MTDVPVAVRGRHALSPTQRALYASQQGDPRAPMQNMVYLVHLDGPIDPQRLGAAFASVVAASDILRTRFVTGATGDTELRISNEPAVTDIVSHARADALSWARQRSGEALPLGRRAYDSAVLVHEDETVSWYLALHHCVTDAASSNLVFERTAEVYEGGSVSLDSYYEWAESAGDHPSHDRARRHWDARAAAPRVGGLYERGVAPTSSSSRVPLDDDLIDGLAGLAGSAFRSISGDLSWAATLLTGTAVFLHRIGGADRFALGLPVHNRSRLDAKELIGPLVEVYPVDIVVEPGDTFASLHRRVGRALNQTLRFAVPGAAPAGSDIEAVVNVLPTGHPAAFASVPASFRWVHPGAIDSNHLVRVQLSRFGAPELALDLNHAAAGPSRLGRAAGHFDAVLRTMVADPESSIAGFALLCPDERQAVDAWGEGPPATPPRHVVELLADRLADSDAVAMVDGEQSWTGRALWEWVRSAAVELQGRGVGPGARVAVEIERSAEAVVAVLATMVAGGSYVPIDPAQPAARRERLIDRAECVVTLRDVAPAQRGGLTAGGPRSLDDEAYLLFTSGSTGEPKGVPISHRGLSGYLDVAVRSYVEPGDRPIVPLFSALTFDLTVTSLFLPLLTGGRLVVLRGDGPAAVRMIASTPELTWCKATPSHLELLARLLPAEHSLTTLVVGGEAFAVALAERLRRARPGVRIFNEYGPTEAVVGCMIHEWDPDGHPGCPDVPIGVPAPGVSLRVVDPAGRLVPPGVVGELHIATDGLTRGYLDGDDAAFVEYDGRRWYRSGDLVRMLDDDTLVYLRRADEQLKVGGIRLDPSEIEAALEEHPAVRRAAVRSWSARHAVPSRLCTRCGLADNVPGVEFDDDGVCDRCHAYDRVRDQAAAWFRTPDDLLAVRDVARAERTGQHDCVALLSGGKDSTYALFQLVRMGFDVYALTLDNGFISDEAKANVRRSVAALGIDHEFATTEEMASIFRDSLERHSTVCHGCFKTIYTLGTNRAVELGAPLVVTGLSRGQLFETRLIPAQFSERRFDPDAIDAAVVAARRAYHRVDDAVRRLLDTDVFATDDLFERIAYVDFYRYVDVELAEMLRFLEEEAPWVRPADTGRSTNCRINAAGIQTHLLEQGYHNYAEPYAWDVRLGHKRRDEALAELDDRDDADEVAAMLAEVDYSPRRRELLTAWIEVDGEGPTPAELRAHLQSVLPAHALPGAFVAVEELPMTTNGKLDVDALPGPRRTHRSSASLVVAPTSPLERRIVERWERQLGVDGISIDDDFFALGGDSLAALEMMIALSEELGADIPEATAFANATPRALAAAVAAHLAAASSAAPAPSGPQPGAGGDPPRLSTGEQAMLFEYRQRPIDPRYNQGRLYCVGAPVDAARYRAALERVVARHQPVRWTFGEPRRALPVDRAISFEHGDLGDWDAVNGAARRLHRRPFDLDTGPLVRCGVFAVGGHSTAIVLVAHHISTDASSFERLWSEVESAYHGDERPPPTISYADLAAWQSARPSDVDAAFWLNAVGATPRMALHRPVATPDGLRTRVCAVRADELRSATGSTPFATVLAALATVVRRYCDADEVTVGALVSTRDHPSAEDLVGYFLNTLPLTVDAAPGMTLGALRSECAATLASALGHRAYPFASMVADRRRAGAADPSPQVLVALQDLDRVPFGRTLASQEILFTGSAVADATFFVQLRGDAVELAIEHRGSVVSAPMADRLLADLDRALASSVRDPDAVIGSPTIDPQPGSLLTGAAAPEADLVTDRIGQHFARRGTRTAVRCGESSLTWAELDERSAAMARRLIAAGVEPGERVIVCLPRSIELVVAIVGVLRAAAAYVPIDPTYPLGRNRDVAAAAGARAVIAVDAEHGLGLDAPVVTAGVDEPSAQGGRTIGLPAARPEDPAYVIYTSGSTGAPRGVVVSHRELAVSTAARDVAYPAAPTGFLVVSSAAFDSSVAGLFWALTTGAAVVLPTDAEVHDVDALVDLFGSGHVSHVLLVPSLYRGVLSRAASSPVWPDQVIVAGEACGHDVVSTHFATRPSSRLANEYGPTEATVWATVAHLEPSGGDVPIGRPIAGVWTAVVDRSGAPSPPGVVGELLIGGATVTDGYDSGESNRFAGSSPLGPGRVFLTGDLAAVSDGQLYYHGRRDDQLNIGGLRVEPAEIESALETIVGVTSAVVVARDLRPLDRLIAAASPDRLADAMRKSADAADPAAALAHELTDGGHASLVAHVETTGGIDPVTVRARLAEMLPPASRPVAVEAHPRLPRSPNGKLDRAIVAGLPVSPRSAPTRLGAADDGSVETLTGFFGEVLGRGDIGPDDDFFDEGGDSLLALELLIRIEQRFGIRPRVSVLFDSRTPRTIAVALDLESESPGPSDEAALVLRDGDSGVPPLWLWPGADGVLLIFQPLVTRLDAGLRVLGVEYPGTRGERPPSDSVEEIGEYCHRAVLAAQPEGPYRMLGYSLGGLVAVDVARRLLADGNEVEYVGAIEAGLAGVADRRGRMAKFVDAWRGRGPRFALRRMRSSLQTQMNVAAARLRTGVERRAIERFGLRPSDRLLFLRMEDRLRDAGLRYRPPTLDADVHLYLGDDATDQWLAAMTREWEAVAGRSLHVEQVSGSHVDNSMLREPDVASVADRVARELGR